MRWVGSEPPVKDKSGDPLLFGRKSRTSPITYLGCRHHFLGESTSKQSIFYKNKIMLKNTLALLAIMAAVSSASYNETYAEKDKGPPMGMGIKGKGSKGSMPESAMPMMKKHMMMMAPTKGSYSDDMMSSKGNGGLDMPMKDDKSMKEGGKGMGEKSAMEGKGTFAKGMYSEKGTMAPKGKGSYSDDEMDDMVGMDDMTEKAPKSKGTMTSDMGVKTPKEMPPPKKEKTKDDKMSMANKIMKSKGDGSTMAPKEKSKGMPKEMMDKSKGKGSEMPAEKSKGKGSGMPPMEYASGKGKGKGTTMFPTTTIPPNATSPAPTPAYHHKKGMMM